MLYVRRFALAALALSAIAVASSPVLAQKPTAPPPPGGPGAPGGKGGPGGQGQKRKTMMERMVEELKLTDKQQKALKPILEAQGKDMKALRDDKTLTRETRGPKMKVIRDKYTPQIEKILTKEQIEKWKAAMAKRRGGGRGGPGGPGGPGGAPGGKPAGAPGKP